MAPLPENSTSRIILFYTSLGREHRFMWRPSAGVLDPTQAGIEAAIVAGLLATRMRAADSVVRGVFIPQGGTVSQPIALTPVPGVIGNETPLWDNDPESAMLSFCGRGFPTGRRTMYCLFTPVNVAGGWPATNRFNPGAAAVIDTFRENLTTLAEEGGWRVTGGNPVTVYNYVNISHNAYWQRKQRRGG